MAKRNSVTWITSTAAKPWQRKAAHAEAEAAPDLALSGSRHQAWEGFGGCFNELGWIALSGLPRRQSDTAIEGLFGPDGCRFTRCRMPIGASDYAAEWYSLNDAGGDFAMKRFSIERDRRFLIPYIRAAQRVQPKLDLFASPWSPPAWLKSPKVYNHGTLVWKPRHLKAYALYLLKTVQAYRAEGIPIVQLHVQNEPLADQKFPSCLWTGPQLRDFIRDYLGPLFARNKEACEIWLGTLNTDDYNGYVSLALGDARARSFIAGVGFQWDGKGAIGRTAESWPGVRLLQTENECGEGRNSWDHAHYVFDLFRHYITSGACGYTYWNMILQPGGRSSWGWPQNAMITADPARGAISLNPEFYVMKHFSRFIDPGAVRLGLSGRWTGNAVAFENPNGSRVIVAANPFSDARTLAAGGPWGVASILMPARSFNTIILG